MTNEKHQQPSYPLRMPAELRERMQKAADANLRTLNAEIVFRLQQSLAAANYMDWPSHPAFNKRASS